MAAALEFERFPDRPDVRLDMCYGVTRTLEFLQEFSVSCFSTEMELYRAVQTVATEHGNTTNNFTRFVSGNTAIFSERRLQDHARVHESFMKHISIWRERFFDDDINCYKEMLLGMASFSTQHFSRDQDMCEVVVEVFASMKGFRTRRRMPPLEYGVAATPNAADNSSSGLHTNEEET
eukprot:TRINITY_DN49933_c0_g1_i1.p1 TRINITY_DN49933_c0_g1~~TRINITY_DN49933_c0_g1_i1.p1  ORF type:complete len:178 (-),score=30.49 TRINITY_DN49933_c0_g1_i1:500-1033(-)